LPAVPLFLDRYRVSSTSGSTGRRGFFLFDDDEWATAIASFRRGATWCGAGVANLFARAAVVTSSVPWHMSAQAGTSLRLPMLRMERIGADRPVAEMNRQLSALQPLLLM